MFTFEVFDAREPRLRTCSESPSRRLRAADGVVVCGNVTLDRQVEDGQVDDPDHDLRVVLRRYESGGIGAVSRLHGRYGIVIWDQRTRTLHLIRDALGLCPLYYKAGANAIEVGDSPELRHSDAKVDRDCIAFFIATGGPPRDRTIWSEVSAVRPGSVVRWNEGRSSVTNYWTPVSFAETVSGSLERSADEFRSLIKNALLQCIDPGERTWAHLSGGHDSSSVVSMAAVMAQEDGRPSLGGTLTLVDSLGSGDESAFSDLVVRRYGLRNEQILDLWPWFDDGEPPPRTAHPTRDYPFYARERLVARTLQRYGATSLLSGLGPDFYLPFTVLHATDLFWTGRASEAVRVAFEWSVARGLNFWTTLGRQLVMPLVPWPARMWLHERKVSAPTWLRPDFVRHHGFARHVAGRDVPVASRRRLLPGLLACRFEEVGGSLDQWMSCPGIEIRHPLLDRRLVEFSLQQPFAHRMHARAPKPILRQAMKGIVPDTILARRTKGAAVLPRVCWALARERKRVDRLLDGSVLADLGVLDSRRMLRVVDQAASGRLGAAAKHLYYALSLETWFAGRYGRPCLAPGRS